MTEALDIHDEYHDYCHAQHKQARVPVDFGVWLRNRRKKGENPQGPMAVSAPDELSPLDLDLMQLEDDDYD